MPDKLSPAVETVDTSYLEGLVGYNASRAAITVIEVFLQRMAVYGMRQVDFSVMSLITHNPGITSSQLCAAMINALERRELIIRKPHPSDGRAVGLHLTTAGQKLMHDAERTAQELELDATAHLTATERKTLIRLLQKVYL